MVSIAPAGINGRRFVVYGAAMLQGFAFTLVPSLATVFASAPYDVNARAFGVLFVPLTIGAIAAAAFAPTLAERHTMARVLSIGVIANICGLLALVSSVAARGHGAYVLLLADTAALGVGFGLNFSAANELTKDLSPNRTRAVTLVNVLTGLGTALTPLFLGALIVRGLWVAWPVALAAAFLCVLIVSLGWKKERRAKPIAKPQPIPRALVLFGIAALLYAICEGVFSSWATTFAHADRGFALAVGEAALSGFWLALTFGRLIVAAATRWFPPRLAFVIFPLAICATLLALPVWPTPAQLIAGFVLGGVACSIVFPYGMALALAAMPMDEDRVAGVLVGALMTGEGFGTFAIGVLHGDAGISLPVVYRVCAIIALALAVVAMLAQRASRGRFAGSATSLRKV